jgi:hypothetical protein
MKDPKKHRRLYKKKTMPSAEKLTTRRRTGGPIFGDTLDVDEDEAGEYCH